MAQWMLVIAVVFGAIGVVTSLRCYQCSSLLEPRCGVEWTFEGDEGQKYLLECPGNTKLCDKIVSDWQGDGMQHTYRLCWNQKDNGFQPIGCADEDVRGGAFCHCAGDGCNGGKGKTVSLWLCLVALAGSLLAWKW